MQQSIVTEAKTNYVLRPYQQDAVDRAVEFFTTNRWKGNAIEVLPTGSGKSLILAAIAKELNAPTLILQPSKEILEQNYDKYCSYGFSAGIFSASAGRKDIGNVTFAMVGSAKNKTDLFKDFKYILQDECHLGSNAKDGMFKNFITQLGNKKMLGVTATPYRLSNDAFGGSMLKFLTRTRPRIYENVIYYIQNKLLFEQGYLSPMEYFSVGGFDRSRLVKNTTGTDYTDKSVHDYMLASGFNNKAVKAVKRLLDIGRKNVLVFTRFIAESEYIASQVEGCAIVTGETPKSERERILTAFKKGEIKAVCNVGVLTTGFDYPELETTVLARPTLSLALYYQMVGRTIRPHPNKKSGWVVDLCGNLELFGKVEDLHLDENKGKWQLTSNGKILTNVYFDR